MLTNAPASFNSLYKFIQIKCKLCDNCVPKVLFSYGKGLMQFLSNNVLSRFYMNFKQLRILLLTLDYFNENENKPVWNPSKKDKQEPSSCVKVICYFQMFVVVSCCPCSPCQKYKIRCRQLILRRLFTSFQNTRPSTWELEILPWKQHSPSASTSWPRRIL
jgi:hypothetical protein